MTRLVNFFNLFDFEPLVRFDFAVNIPQLFRLCGTSSGQEIRRERLSRFNSLFY
jgi:hypothetical protein